MIDKLVVCLLLVSTLVVVTWSANQDGACPSRIYDMFYKKLTSCKSCLFDFNKTRTCIFEETRKKNNVGEVCITKTTCMISQKILNNVLVWTVNSCPRFRQLCHQSSSMSSTTFISIGVGCVVVVACIVVAVVWYVKRRRNNNDDFTNFWFM